MSISYNEKQEAINKLFEYEESHNIPKEQRMTIDPYADDPKILEPSPRKRAYVDIRDVVGLVKKLGL